MGKAYAAVGQAGACLHTMAILQAYQADLLRDLNEGEGVGLDAVKELRQATKKLAHATGHSMAAKVAAERNLWLNLSGFKEKDKPFFLDAPLSLLASLATQSTLLPRGFMRQRNRWRHCRGISPDPGPWDCSKEQPQLSTSSSHRQQQKQIIKRG